MTNVDPRVFHLKASDGLGTDTNYEKIGFGGLNWQEGKKGGALSKRSEEP
jgi:hypothetical protein